MNKILLGLLALSIAGNAYLVLKPKKEISNSVPEKVIVKETEVVNVKDLDALKALDIANEKISRLEKENLKLQDELDLIKDREALAKLSKDVTQETLDSVANNENILSDDTLAKIEEKKQAVINLFEQEAIDESWAYQTQDSISRVLNESTEINTYDIEELKCKSTICKIKLKPYKQNNNGAVMAGISASSAIHIGGTFKGFDTELNLGEDEGTHYSTMYLIKH